MLEPFGYGGWVGEVGEGIADSGDGFEDAVVVDVGENSLEEEVGEVVVCALDRGWGVSVSWASLRRGSVGSGRAGMRPEWWRVGNSGYVEAR